MFLPFGGRLGDKQGVLVAGGLVAEVTGTHHGCLALPETIFCLCDVFLNSPCQLGLLLDILRGWQGLALP